MTDFEIPSGGPRPVTITYHTYTADEWKAACDRARRTSELHELRAKAEGARSRARHASNRRWKTDEKERASRAKAMEQAFHELKLSRPSLSDRRAAALTAIKFKVSYSTILRAAGLKKVSPSSKNEPDAIG